MMLIFRSVFFSFWITSLTILLSFSVSATEVESYVVRLGDNLSIIAQSKIGSPVYPRNSGSLDHLVRLNPGLNRESIIFPGQVVYITKQQPGLAQASEARVPAALEPPTPAPTQVVQQQQAAPPALSPAIALDAGDEIQQLFRTSVEFGMTSLSATDIGSSASAVLNSSRDVKVEAGLQHDWSPNFSTYIYALIRDVDFEDSTSTTKNLISTHKTMPGLGFSLIYSPSEKLRFDFDLSRRGQIYIHGLSTTDITVDSVSNTQFSAGANYEFYRRGKTAIGANLRTSILQPNKTDGYELEMGYSWLAGFEIERRYNANSKLSVGFSFQNRVQKSSIIEFNESTMMGTLKWHLPLFEGEAHQ